jgi:hypothetical protein
MDKGPDVPEAPPPDDRPTLFLTAGYSNKLYFRGLDILDRVSPNDATGAMTTRMKLTKGGWEFGAQYLQALDRQLPDREALRSEPNLTDPVTGLPNPNASDYENFRVRSKDRYAELDLWLSYTRPLGAGFTGTLGATYYHFLNEDFWGVDHAFELQAGLSYTRLPYIAPSLLYAYDFDGFKGGYAELTVTAKDIPYWPLFSSESKWSIVPYGKLAYDFSYNGSNSGWNHAELGVNIPVSVGKNFALNLNAAYVEDLGDQSGGRDRTDSGFWFGVSMSTATKIGAFPDDGMGLGKGKMVRSDPEDYQWDFSGGDGWRSMKSDFRQPSQSNSPALGLVQQRANEGTLGFATAGADKVYADGTVLSGSQPGAINGTSRFTGGEVSGTRENRDQQVRFHSRTYSYSNVLENYDRNISDDDDVMSPYFRVDRSVGLFGHAKLSVGFMYSYTGGEFDSGISLSSLDKAIERQQEHHYLYDVNELDDVDARLGNATVIFDAAAMAGDSFFAGNPSAQAFYATRTPQEALIETSSEVKRVATFVSSKLDASLHAISVPVSLQWQLSDRAYLAVSAGPTLNILSSEFTTESWARELDNLSAGQVISNTTGNLVVRSGAPFSGDFVEGNQMGPKIGGTSTGVPGSPNTPANSDSFGGGSVGSVRPAEPASPVIPNVNPGNPGTPGNPGGGKGGTALSPRLPGVAVANGYRSSRDNSTEFEFGIFAQASIKYDLDQKKRWYMEAWGRYDYVQPFNMNNSGGRAEVDASSWGFGAGLGYRF